ncbi:MAG: hypothetical protein ACT4QG_19965 [Sporichthyaceae bacterium]
MGRVAGGERALPELDLLPTGRFVEVWTGGDLDDESNRRTKELEEGTVIAEGVAGCHRYGSTHAERARFIVETIRTHLGQTVCAVHTIERDGIERAVGRPMDWCLACGVRIDAPDRRLESTEP